MPRRTIVYYRFTSKLGEGSMGEARRAPPCGAQSDLLTAQVDDGL